MESVLLHRKENGLFVYGHGEELSIMISRSKSLRAKSNNARRCCPIKYLLHSLAKGDKQAASDQ